MQLVVGLAAQQRAALARAAAFAAGPPSGRRRAAAAASAGSSPPPARCRRSSGRGRCRSARRAELGSSASALLERLLDPLAVARGGEPLAAQHPPLHARAVRRAEVEPRLGALRLALGPRPRGRDRRVDLRARTRRRAPCSRSSSWICHQSAGDVEQLAGLRRRRAARPRRSRRPPRRSARRGSRRRPRRGARTRSSGAAARAAPAASVASDGEQPSRRDAGVLTPRSSAAAASRRGARARARSGDRAARG